MAAPEIDPSNSRYTEGAYARENPDWHLPDAPFKAADLYDAFRAIHQRNGQAQELSIADIGAGAAGVLAELVAWHGKQYPSLRVHPTGFEIAADAVAIAAQHFPHIMMRNKFVGPTDGPFDVTMFVDVLEHVENPWELLRIAHRISRFLVVRQPLLESFSTFRHANYAGQRKQWGHIGFFNYHSFVDMAAACGWKPLALKLDSPWEMASDRKHRTSVLKKWFVKWNRQMASQFIAGFYLNGVFEHAES